MLTKKKLLCFLVSFSLLVSVFANGFVLLAALYNYDDTASPTKYTYSGSLTIEGVNYADPATDSQLASSITKIDLQDQDDITVNSSQYAALTVDGVERDIAVGSYNGTTIVITVSEKAQAMQPAMGPGVSISSMVLLGQQIPITYYTRAAAVIADNTLQAGYSVQDALIGGITDSTSSAGATINAQGSYFGGYYIDDSDYAISGLNMTLNGYGADDFSGWGAGITATDGANVALNNAYIDTTGVIRTAVWVGGENANLTADNIVVVAHNDTSATTYSASDNYAAPMLERVPFALGLEGNIRATNVLGSSKASYSNSIVVSNGWGALSTDSGAAGTNALTVSDTLSGIGTLEPAKTGVDYKATKTVNGTTYGFNVFNAGEGSGYVTYADAGVIDTFNNVNFYSPDYIGIIASGTSTMNFTDSYGYSDRIGFMSHQTKGGALNITGGTFDVADSFIMVKSNGNVTEQADTRDYLNINIIGSQINLFGDNAQSGVLLQLIESDDAGGPFTTTYTIDDKTLEEIKAVTPGTSTLPTVANFKDVTVDGDIYNSVYSTTEDLDVTFSNSSITGTISSSVAHHVDLNGNPMDGMTVTGGNDGYLAFGRLVNETTEAVNNDVNLTLTDSTWAVTGTSYLSSLILDMNSAVKASGNALLTMTVDGAPTDIVPGETYTGNIVLSLVTNYVIDNQTGITFGTVPTFTGNATSYTGRGTDDYSVGYYVSAGSILAAHSLLTNTDADASSLDLDLDAYGVGFNPVIATGSETDLTLTGSINIYDGSDGQDASDFSGLGAAIVAANGAKVTVDRMDIYTEGFVRAAFIADSNAQLLVKDSNVTVMGANPLNDAYSGYVNSAIQNIMLSPPWVLGIQGGARTSNLLGDTSTMTVLGSTVIAGGWGVLSTDAGSDDVLNVVDSTIRILPESQGGMSSGPFAYSADYGSGYGTYIIGNAQEYFYGVDFAGTTYASILTGGDAYFASSNGGITLNDAKSNAIDTVTGGGKVTTIDSVFGFMAHNSGSINVLDGTVVNTEEAAFLYKAGDVRFNADDAVLNPSSGILLQMIDNDDSTVGASMGAGGPIFNTMFHETAGWPGDNGNVTTAKPDDNAVNHTPFGDVTGPNYNTVNLDLTNGNYKGDVFNGTGYYNQVGDVLNVTIGSAATLDGAISLTETRHVDENGAQNTDFTIDEYYYLGHVENKVYDNGNSKLAVTLKDGGDWTVKGTSQITNLTVGEGSAITAPSGYTVVMTVDGTNTVITAGTTYTGAIVLSLQSISSGYVSGVTHYTITATAATGGNITPATTTVTSGSSATFTIAAVDGFKIADVLVDGVTVGAVDSYTFSNITANHTIKAVFDKEIASWTNPFADVNESDWYYDNVTFVVQKGLFTGTSGETFGPHETMTRAMLVTVLYRLADNPDGGRSAFDDVQSDKWYAAAVSWAADNGIVTAISNGMFNPNAPVTREQIAVILYNFAKYKVLDVSATGTLAAYSDNAEISGGAADAMRWAVGAGLFKGDSSGNLNPGDPAMRGEVAALLQRFIENVL